MTDQQTTLEILDALIGFPSISRDSNLDIVSWIESYLARHDVRSQRIADRTGAKASILATIGPSDRAGIVLSAHTDVVPVDGQDWSSPPFTATRRDNRIVGRGATDMKGFIAGVLAHAPHFKAAATQTPVHIALSYDEEVGCLGAPDLVDVVASLPTKPALCIVGEPTGLNAVYAHKGKVARRIIVTGRGGHSALPHRAANAVTAAARLVNNISDLADTTSNSDVRDEAFDPPYTTIHVGSLHGGTALNLVPDRAVIEFEIRDIPGTDVASLLAQIDRFIDEQRNDLKRQASEADIIVENISSYPSLMIAQNDAAVATVARLADSKHPAGTVSFGTEAGLYAKAGIPTVVCGPGDIGRAHKADEWIGIDELAQADAMMKRLAAHLNQPAEQWIKA
ncbi:acetylornithine deacetylase [Pseudorhodoplanes sinuspersici]|uniref:Acetylornithine deacetylase n=1 Tax=Pseudorhodoplanes sinuspersici TaxID=1235591 RepID=A0A1W6ZTC8_9HYPH|nr:acetylornithine deacetylase [Pseudorhodoplanes sinuspersici]ARQ00556.1 acetylornithine deacetylase [Pseudorhodoplanes sinuspersici]RKE72149.1 acetylornithine deacetylase [Pseudorhodoplanes sinuspersici]